MRGAGIFGIAGLTAMLALAGCGGGSADAPTGAPTPDTDRFLAMNTILVANSCSNCHASDYARVGPSMKDVAAVLGGDTPQSRTRLREAILNGSKGKWGEAIMPAQKQVAPDKVDAIVATILAVDTSEPK
jgi:cytochrome c551/c552